MIPKNSKLIPLGDAPYYLSPDNYIYKCTGKVLLSDNCGRYRLRVKDRYIAYSLNFIIMKTQETYNGNPET